MAVPFLAYSKEPNAVMRLKIGVSRKQATDDDGSVGATCEIEVEIPGGATDAEVLRIRDHWLGICEATVDEELQRLRGGTVGRASTSSSEPAARSRPAPSRSCATRISLLGPAPRPPGRG